MTDGWATWRHKHSTGLVGSPCGNSCNTRWSPGWRRGSSPTALAAPLLGADFTHTSLYAELATRAGIRLDRGHEDVHAMVPTTVWHTTV